MIKILNLEPEHYSSSARKILKSFARIDEEFLVRKDLLRRIQNYDVLIVRLKHQIDQELIEKAINLKAIVSATTGLDHIDVRKAEKKGIRVLSLKGEVNFLKNITATAEHTWALILALIRKLPYAYQDVLAGNWTRNLYRGHELQGKTLGIIGYGRLGQKVASYGRVFRMKVYYNDSNHTRAISNKIKYLPLKKLIPLVDVLSVHVPLSPDTVHLIDREQLSQMKSSSIIVNTSRGGIVNESALLDCLKNKKISGAALDVLEGEEQFRLQNSSWPKNDALIRYAKTHNNLIITPHIGGATVDSMEKTEIFMANKLKSHLLDAGIIHKTSSTNSYSTRRGYPNI